MRMVLEISLPCVDLTLSTSNCIQYLHLSYSLTGYSKLEHGHCWNEFWPKYTKVMESPVYSYSILGYLWISLCPCGNRSQLPSTNLRWIPIIPSPRYRWTSAARRNATAGRKPPGASGTLKAMPGGHKHVVAFDGLKSNMWHTSNQRVKTSLNKIISSKSM